MVLIAVRGRAMPITLGSTAMLVLGHGDTREPSSAAEC